ncbi:MAG TPA: glycine cleavage system protein GcvH [Treponema sp.]|nr:glycine cleavage system protein GcvH [Treponema sp.]
MSETEKMYSKSHEWIAFSNETTAKIGITDYAQNELGDIVFVNLPEPGNTVTAGKQFADVESVKAVADVYSPVTGVVKAVNEELLEHPEKINQDAEGAWFAEIEQIIDKEQFLDKAAYDAFAASEKKE